MGKRRKKHIVPTSWPLGFLENDLCSVAFWDKTDGRYFTFGRISKRLTDRPNGLVSVIIGNEIRQVPLENLYPCPKCQTGTGKICGIWGGEFMAGELVRHNGREARITFAYPCGVALGEVPITYLDENPRDGYTCVPLDSIESSRPMWHLSG
jgi:hypothetical protein